MRETIELPLSVSMGTSHIVKQSVCFFYAPIFTPIVPLSRVPPRPREDFAAGRNVDIWDKGQIVGTLTPKMIQVERQNIAAIAIFLTLYSAEGLGFEGKSRCSEGRILVGSGLRSTQVRPMCTFSMAKAQAWTEVRGSPPSLGISHLTALCPLG